MIRSDKRQLKESADLDLLHGVVSCLKTSGEVAKRLESLDSFERTDVRINSTVRHFRDGHVYTNDGS